MSYGSSLVPQRTGGGGARSFLRVTEGAYY